MNILEIVQLRSAAYPLKTNGLVEHTLWEAKPK